MRWLEALGKGLVAYGLLAVDGWFDLRAKQHNIENDYPLCPKPEYRQLDQLHHPLAEEVVIPHFRRWPRLQPIECLARLQPPLLLLAEVQCALVEREVLCDHTDK